MRNMNVRKYVIKGKGGSIKIGKYNYSILEGEGLIYVNDEGKIVIDGNGLFKISDTVLQVINGNVTINKENVGNDIKIDGLDIIIYHFTQMI